MQLAGWQTGFCISLIGLDGFILIVQDVLKHIMDFDTVIGFDFDTEVLGTVIDN